MGCQCTKDENINADQTYDIERYKYLESCFKSMNNIVLLIKLQNKFRQLLANNKLKVLKVRSNVPELNIPIMLTDDNFPDNVDSNQIDLNMLKEVFKKYPRLKDNVETEIRNNIAFDDGSVYYGEWKLGTNIKHGRGIQIWDDGSMYQGQFHNNKAHYLGKLIHQDGDFYEGEWFEGKAQGKGMFVSHYDGSFYKGDWYQDKQHGKGEEHWKDGSKYIGDYFFCKKTGKGKFIWSNGSTYEGDFLDNEISGKGKIF